MTDDASVSSGDDTSPLFIVSENENPTNRQQNPTRRACSKHQHCITVAILSLILVVLSVALLGVVEQHNKDTVSCNTHKEGRKKGTTDDIFFFQLSDIHLDVNYNESVTFPGQKCRDIRRKNTTKYNISQTAAAYGRVDCDTPIKLLFSVAQHMKKINVEHFRKAQFVILSGDQMAHDYDEFKVNKFDTLLRSIRESTRLIAETLQIPVIPAIGNNDLLKDYEPPVGVAIKLFYEKIASILTPYIFPNGSITAKLNSISQFQRDFYSGGYYSLNVTDDVMVMVVNSNYWNKGAFDINPKIKEIGQMQMNWFSNQLAFGIKTNKKVIITGHIPPGISSYGNEGSFWLDEFAQKYVDLVTQYHKIVIGQLYGHVHQDKIKIHQVKERFLSKTSKKNSSYLLICPSITPIYNNNPAFRLFSLDKNSKEMVDYAQYYMDLLISNVYQKAIWNLEYRFTEVYGSTLSLDAVAGVVDGIVSPVNSTWIPYSNHMKTLFGETSSTLRFVEHCAARYVNRSNFKTCIDYFKTRGV